MKLALITGGSRGLGQALVAHYQSTGWIVREFSRHGQGSPHCDLDLSQPGHIDQSLRDALMGMELSALTDLVIIHNAGQLTPLKAIPLLEPDEIQQHLTMNLIGPIEFISRCLTLFGSVPCRKHLVNISSGAAIKGHPGWSLYCTAKAGMENFIRALRLEQADKPHPFVAFNFGPHVMDTQMQSQIRTASPDACPERERFIRFHEEGRLLSPALVASTLADLLNQPALSESKYDVLEYLAQ